MTDDYIDIAEPGESLRLPLVDILTGRGFVTGKSGSGKSNSVNVVVEEMLDLNQPLLIVDTDGEYWGLKEQYQILHLGNGEQCDVRVTSTDAETIVDLALVERVPIILDISGFIHKEDAQDITHRVVRELFHREKTLKEPFLLIVEEVHEYIPESGGLSDMGEMLIQVAKRGRKHGLGFVGVSQRPASVDKDFITQCDWITWHRLTWKNDTDVVSTILGPDAANTVEDLDPGEALLMTDWDEQIRNVQFRQKRTFDAGATPGFEDYDPPDLIPVNPAILNRFDERRQNVDYGSVGTDDEADDETDGQTDGSAADTAGAGPSAETSDDETTVDDADPTDDEGGAADATEGDGVAETVALDDDPMVPDDTADGDGAVDAESAQSAAEDGESDSGGETVSDAEPAEPAAEAETAVTPATGETESDADATTDRPPLGDEPVEAELVSSQPNAKGPVPRNGSRGSPRSGRGRQAPAPPTDTSEGVLVEFTELVLFLTASVRRRAERAVLWLAGGIGRAIRSVRGGARTVTHKTHLADEDVVVAMWLALLLAFILLLSVVLVGVL